VDENEWLSADDPVPLLHFLADKVSDRRLRLFACACVRLVWSKVPDQPSRAAVEVVERFADGLITRDELDSVRYLARSDSLAAIYAGRRSSVRGALAVAHEVRETVYPGWWRSRQRSRKRKPLGWPDLADLLRHISGNPFRPYPAPPSWPPAVVNLAQAVYNGADACFALHDALLESGHPELAAHFMEQEWHPKGCRVVDLILGKN